MRNTPIKIIILAFIFPLAACETKTDPDFGKPPADSGSAISRVDSGIDARTDSPGTGTGGVSGGTSGNSGGGIGGGGTSDSGGTGVPTSCAAHEDCAGAACDLVAGECVTCVKEGELTIGCDAPRSVCAPAASPADNRCVDVECETDSDCVGTERICDSTTNTCVICVSERGCEEPSFCTEGASPQDNRCLQCVEDDDCERGVCDEASNECVACVLEQGEIKGCGSDLAYCWQPDYDATNNACVECLDDTQCTRADRSACGDEHECEKCQQDSDCEGIEGRTVCDASQGCVQCKASGPPCPETSAVCDKWSCRGCTSHADCDFAGGICEMSTGRCYLRDEVIFVNDDLCDSGGDGSAGNPYCDLQEGIYHITNTKRTIRVEGVHGPITVSNRGEVRVFGVGSAVIGGATDVSDSAIYVERDTQLTIEGVRINESRLGIGIECVGNSEDKPTIVVRDSIISNNANEGVKSSDCTVMLEGNEITSNTGGGVSTSGGTVTLEGNEITSNTGGGVSLASCDFTVTNNVIAGNGASTLYGGVRITSPGTNSALFHSNTVVGNFAGGTNEAGVKCDDEANIVSSIVFGNLSNGNEVSDACKPNYSLIEDGSGDQSETADNNLTGDPSFISETNFNLETEESDKSRCIDTGDPASPLTRDIDGNVRPQGERSDMGAYEAI